MRFIKILKLAEFLYDNDNKTFNKMSLFLDSCIKKMAHYIPDNNGETPIMWKKNLDYGEYENSPYFGNVGDFLKKFPGGIKDWLEWRKKTQKERNKLWDIKKRTAYISLLMKYSKEK